VGSPRCERRELLRASAQPSRRRSAVAVIDAPADERRDHLVQLSVQLAGECPALGELGSEQFREQVLERPPAAYQPEVRQRRGGEQSAQEIEDARSRRRLPRALGLPGDDWIPGANPIEQGRDERRVGLEEPIEGGLVRGMGQLRSPVIGESSVGTAAIEADVTRGLLQR
jgi:hypothetical protein